MRNWGWLAVLGSCSLLACGGSARATHDQGPDTNDTAGGAVDVAGGAGIDNAAGGAGAGSVHLAPGSWEVSGDINALTTPALKCGRFDFTMTVDDRGTLTLGRNGEMHSAPVQILDGAYVASSVRLVGTSNSLPCGLSANVVDELRLEGVDRDGDGEADELEGTVSFSFDTKTVTGKAETTTLSSHLTATRDRSSPTLIVPAAALNPLDFATILASEPLDFTTTLALTGSSHVDLERYERSSPPVPGATIAFSLLQILPLGGTWQLTGPGKDLSGHALDVSGALSTLADPGVQAQDGFEGVLSASGDGSLVIGFGSSPAISGEHSLWLERGSRTLVHLQRIAGQKTLHFAVRYFGKQADPAHYQARSVRAGVMGGAHGVAVTAVGSAKVATSRPAMRSSRGRAQWCTSRQRSTSRARMCC